MDAIVTAGGIPEPGEPLYEYAQGRPKALIEIAGRPLIQWVLDALAEAQSIERVVVVGIARDLGLHFSAPLEVLPNHGSMLQNIRAAARRILELNPSAQLVMNVSSDIPAIRGEMIDWITNTVLETGHDLYYTAIPREVMETRFPGSNRSYLRLRDVEVCGGDIHVYRPQLVTTSGGIWDQLLETRKHVLRQAAMIGFDTLLLLLFRRLTLESGVNRASRRLGIRGRVILSPYAEIAMDVDKPAQLELLRSELEQAVLP